MKQISITDLDGEYEVAYSTEAPRIPGYEWFDHAGATVQLLNGVMTGGDESGIRWDAKLLVVPDGKKVAFNAWVDPSRASVNSFVMDKNGKPTRAPQNYTGTLNVASSGSSLTMYGTVNHGVVNIPINFKRK